MVVTNIYRTLHGNGEAIGSKPGGGGSIYIDNKSVKKANDAKANQKKGGCKCWVYLYT